MGVFSATGKRVAAAGQRMVVRCNAASAHRNRYRAKNCSTLRPAFLIADTGMTRALPRTNFNSSTLLRLLADLSVDDAAESTPAFAERLGEWLDFSAAIALSTLLGTHVAMSPAARSGASSAAGLSIEAAFARVQATLVTSITTRCASAIGETQNQWPAATPGAVSGRGVVAAAYAPWRRLHAAQQREMESALRPLRALLRDALSKASPALRQLATLDAAMDRILGERERSLMATVPLLLEKRFGQRLQAHQQMLGEPGPVDDPALWSLPGGWLAGFGQEFQAALLAELDLRLQPTIGLMEAFSNEASRHQCFNPHPT